jgi:hypothetical protein
VQRADPVGRSGRHDDRGRRIDDLVVAGHCRADVVLVVDDIHVEQHDVDEQYHVDVIDEHDVDLDDEHRASEADDVL